MERLGIVVDLAHASEQLITDVLAVATRAVVASHTGVKGTCDRTRNLSDEQVRSIASNGGLIGIAFFDEAVCGTEVDSIVIALRYTVNLVGVAHVALGSDFDGAVTTPFDVTGLPHLTVALLKSGSSRQEVEAITGKNIVRLLRQALPKQSMDL
jgi:membrane dipeptidase